MLLLFPAFRKHAVAFAFLVSCTLAQAQGFAPDSLANMIYNIRATSATGVAVPPPSSGLLTATGFDYTVNATGVPLSNPVRYTYQKTGANTGSVIETDGIVMLTVAVTFTSTLTGTFRETITGSNAVINGEVIFTPIPGAAVAPPAGGSPPLVNISTRATLAAGQILTPGFVVGGTVPRRVLVRAIGPTLTAFGVTNPLTTPTLAVFSGSTQIASNAGWGGGAALSSAFTSVGAFALPTASRDAALILTLNPGNYTAQVAGGSGEALAEVYFID